MTPVLPLELSELTVPLRLGTLLFSAEAVEEHTYLVTWSRLSRVSWSELNTRLQQEVGKRLDLVRYWTGGPRTGLVNPERSGSRANFFFAQADLPQLLDLLRDQLPSEVESVVREAVEICRHRFSLLGYTGLDYGRAIDWHLDAVSGKRAPVKPWFKIHYLDFNEVGDHKVTWELNRHQHLVTLAKAWHFTRNKAYVDEVVEQLESWRRANPYPIGINWASTLEVAFRSLAWLWLQELLAGCEFLPAASSSQLVSGLATNGHHIERYLSTYFSPNTHLLGEAAALFFIGTLCPQLAAASRWQRKGWQILTQEIHRQVRADGVYFEQALYYHVYALDFFLHARILAARNGVEAPPEFDAKLERMLQVLHSLTQAGPPEAFGDDDGGRVFNPRRNRTEHLSDPLALGAILYGRKDLAATSLTEESIWLFGKAAVNTLCGTGEQRKTAEKPIEQQEQLHSAAFPDGGVYVMADTASRAQLMIDAGAQGTGRCGHGHADALEILLSANGRRWLVDSGTYRYISDSDDRNIFRGTAAHNTLRVDRMDQAVPDGPFAWSSIPQVSVERWIQGASFDFFAGHHNGYARLPQPVKHRRYVFRLAGGFWLVRDVAEGVGIHEIEIFWHFAADLELSVQGAIEARTPRRSAFEPGQLAMVSCANETAWSRRTGTAEISAAYGEKNTAPCVSFVTSSQLPVDFAVLLAPGITDAPLGELVSLPSSAADGLRSYRYQSDKVAHYFLFSQIDSWKSGSWASDAKFMYCCLEDGQLAHLILVDGSHASWQEAPVVRLHHKVDRFERIHREGTLKTFCSDSGAVEYNFEGRLTCFDTVVQM